MTPRDYALLAQEAYTAAPDIGVADSASRAIVRETAAGLCVAFPGTDNFASVAADLDALVTDVPRVGVVHSGFWGAWTAIRAQVLTVIAGRPVTLCGHSLGAAMAILAGADLTASGNTPIMVYGFEPPRVCRGPLLVDFPMTLYKKGNDLVPDVPLGLEHAGPLAHIGTADYPWPNVSDHAIAGVILAL